MVPFCYRIKAPMRWLLSWQPYRAIKRRSSSDLSGLFITQLSWSSLDSSCIIPWCAGKPETFHLTVLTEGRIASPPRSWTLFLIRLSLKATLMHHLNPSDHPNREANSVSGYSSYSWKVKDLLDVFDEKKADILQSLKPYDCPIDLKLGAEVPFGPVHTLLEPELYYGSTVRRI